MPTITACIIARDEAPVLARCLQSIAALCDEVCVLDTGSTDATVEVAAAHGARVATSTSCNGPGGLIMDFSRARNECSTMATGDWILSIDADEILQPAAVLRIARHLGDESTAALRIRLRSGRSQWPAVRIFRRLPEHAFRGRIHEHIVPAGNVVTDNAIVIANVPKKIRKEDAVTRDLRLCAAALEDEPGNARMALYMARALQRSGQLKAARLHYEHYLVLAHDFAPGCHSALLGIATCNLLSGEWRAAIRSAKRAAKLQPQLAESYCILGDACLALRQYGAASSWYEKALSCRLPSVDYPLFVDRSCYSTYPRRQLRFLRAHSVLPELV